VLELQRRARAPAPAPSALRVPTVVGDRRGVTVFAAGQFLDSNEYLVGFWIVGVPDRDSAHTLVAEASKHCN